MGHPGVLTSAAFGFLVVAGLGGCGFGQTGIAPPTDRIFLPAGIAVDPDGRFLYVVNSNSDLRYNAGTVVAVDLSAQCGIRPDLPGCALAQAPSPPTTIPVCTKTRFSRTEAIANDYCCRDLVDSNVVNCHESQFIQPDATIEIGSFGGAVALQTFVRDGVPVRRLFMAVRAEPSITYADLTVSDDGARVAMRCSGPHESGAPPETNAFCDDGWKIRRPGGVTPGALVLPDEPHVLVLDRVHQALFVGHLTVTANGQVQGGGVSALDVCNPEHENPVRFAGLARTTFLPAGLSQAVAMLSPPDPSRPATEVYATARYSTAVSGLVFRDPGEAACDNTALAPSPEARDLTLLASEHFYSSAFLPNGTDVRGIVFHEAEQPNGDKLPLAFVLHRNGSDTTADPAAIAVLDRKPSADGTPANAPVALLQVCNGPSSLQMHDAGRGDRIFVTCYDDGQIYVIDPTALVVTAVIDAGAAPTSLVFSTRDSGIAYVASFFNSHLSLIDLRPGSPTENRVLLRIGLPHGYGE